MNTLDHKDQIKKIDQSGMYEVIYNFPAQFEDGLKRTRMYT